MLIGIHLVRAQHFVELSHAPVNQHFVKMSNSLEVIACEIVLQNLLHRMANGPDFWDSVGYNGTRCWNPLAEITIEDVEHAHAMSKLWKCEIDHSFEYACLRLAKWDYDSYSEGQ